MTIKVGDILAVDITLTASDGSKLVADGTVTITEVPDVVPIPPDPGPEPTPPGPGAAQWIVPESMVISSLEVGHIGHVYAWGGSAYGYGYAYSLEGAPAGVAIDKDSGRLSLTSALTAGDKAFKIVVADRSDAALTAKFNFTFHVKLGVTSNRSGDQILHKTYDVTSGTWGNPSGVDWTQPMKNMRNAIIADQIAAGEGNLRADIIFRRGKEYQYTWNRWPTGIQYFRAMANSGTAALPIMKCTRGDPNDPYNSGPLGTESSNAISKQGHIKEYTALINTTQVGDNTVTLKSTTDAAKIHPGRMHAIVSGSQQLDGYPPNVKQIDYVIVKSVSGGTVTLDRKLKYAHREDYWEQQDSWLSLGRAWIVPWDMHDDSNDPMKPRMIQRGQFIGLDFTPGSSDITYVESFVELFFEDCDIPNPQFTMSEFMVAKSCRLHGGEPDKMMEQASYIDCTNDAEMGGATGVAYFVIRGGNHRGMQVSPRQFRAIDTKIDAHGSTYLSVPFSLAYPGPILEYEFDNVEFVADGSQATWTWGNPPAPALTLGSSSWIDDGTGATNRLVIPRSFGPFGDWLVWAHEGLMIMAGNGTVQNPASYGVITKISAPSNASAMWFDVTWKKGTKPTSGTITIPQHGSRKLIWKNNTRITKGGWLDPSFECQQGTPTDRAFPDGIKES